MSRLLALAARCCLWPDPLISWTLRQVLTGLANGVTSTHAATMPASPTLAINADLVRSQGSEALTPDLNCCSTHDCHMHESKTPSKVQLE